MNRCRCFVRRSLTNTSATFPKLNLVDGALFVDTSSNTFSCSGIDGLSGKVRGKEQCTVKDSHPTTSGTGSGSGTSSSGGSSGSPASSSSSAAMPLQGSGFVAGTGLVGALLAFML